MIEIIERQKGLRIRPFLPLRKVASKKDRVVDAV